MWSINDQWSNMKFSLSDMEFKSLMDSTGQLWRKQLENPFPASDPIRKTESQNVS